MSDKRGRAVPAIRLQELRPAPGELRLMQDFLNSADFEAATDDLASLGGLASWLERHMLLPPDPEPEPVDVGRASDCRESLRAMLAAGETANRELCAAVDRAMVSALLGPRFEAGGILQFQPAAAGLGGALGRLLAIIAAAQRDGLWSRLKICASGTCRAAFYDYSNNHNRLWCLPRCGGRIRGRIYRQRRKHLGLR